MRLVEVEVEDAVILGAVVMLVTVGWLVSRRLPLSLSQLGGSGHGVGGSFVVGWNDVPRRC